MSLDAAAARTGGKYVKLLELGDILVGTLLEIDTEKERRDPKGNVVVSKKTNQARKVFGLLVQTDAHDDAEDDGKRRFDANESAQYAIIDAFKEWRKENPTGEPIGCKFWIQVSKAREDEYSQNGYTAKFGERVMNETSALDAAAAQSQTIEPPF